ncbi:MAG: hypothetical protein WC789_12335 [Lentisphaeria bacterium]
MPGRGGGSVRGGEAREAAGYARVRGYKEGAAVFAVVLEPSGQVARIELVSSPDSPGNVKLILPRLKLAPDGQVTADAVPLQPVRVIHAAIPANP